MGHSLEVNGIKSNDYGVIISGGGTYATPRRKVTSTQVPGRNGDIQYDENAFENCIVTYPCGIAKGFESDYLPFIRKLKAQPVYSKITDTYHPQYFRYGTVIEEMVPEVGTILRSGKFDLQFDCKPQRFLTSGDTPTSYTPTPKTLPATYSFADFPAGFQNQLITLTRDAGYTTSDIQNMEFLIGTGASTSATQVSVEVESMDPFFAVYADQDPLNYVWSIMSQTGASYMKNFPLSHGLITWTGANVWVVIARVPEAKIYIDNTLALDYDYFNEFSLTNPTDYTAQPLIRAEVSSTFDDYLFGINGCYLRYNAAAVTEGVTALTLDADTMNCYALPADNTTGEIVNCNKYVELSNWSLKLEPGANDILVGNYCDKLNVTPRWWTL